MIVPTLAPKLFTKSIQKRTDTWSKNNQTLSTTVKDLLHGAMLLRRYNATTGFSKRMDQSISGMEASNASLKNQIALSNNVIGLLFSVFSYIPIGLGIYFTIVGKITLAQFVAIQYSSSWILNGFNQIITSWNTISSTKSIRTKVEQLQPVVTIVSNDKPENVGELSVDNVSFTYDKKEVFQNVSFDVKHGEKILIGGKSGIGKSTLIRMVLKELQPSAGKILLDNHSYSQRESYDSFGIVGQTPIIFEDSLERILL
jgi:ABC-type multidrug transport system, ATPase and permease components